MRVSAYENYSSNLHTVSLATHLQLFVKFLLKAQDVRHDY